MPYFDIIITGGLVVVVLLLFRMWDHSHRQCQSVGVKCRQSVPISVTTFSAAQIHCSSSMSQVKLKHRPGHAQGQPHWERVRAVPFNPLTGASGQKLKHNLLNYLIELTSETNDAWSTIHYEITSPCATARVARVIKQRRWRWREASLQTHWALMGAAPVEQAAAGTHSLTPLVSSSSSLRWSSPPSHVRFFQSPAHTQFNQQHACDSAHLGQCSACLCVCV